MRPVTATGRVDETARAPKRMLTIEAQKIKEIRAGKDIPLPPVSRLLSPLHQYIFNEKNMKDFGTYFNQIINLVIAWGPRLLLAIGTLFVGWRVIRWLVSLMGIGLERNNVDISLRYFLKSLIDVALKVLLIVSVASMVGIATTSFVAILGAAGLAIGLALQGNLSNFAGGVLILLMKPYRAGDYILAQGQSGVVREIQLFYTILKTADGRTVIIPNGKLSNDTIVNFSVEPRRRVELIYTCSDGTRIRELKKLFADLFESESRIMKEPPPSISVVEQPSHTINITLAFWVLGSDAEEISADFRTNAETELIKAGHTATCTRMDTHTSRQYDVPTQHLGLPSERDDSAGRAEPIASTGTSSSSSQDKKQ